MTQADAETPEQWNRFIVCPPIQILEGKETDPDGNAKISCPDADVEYKDTQPDQTSRGAQAQSRHPVTSNRWLRSATAPPPLSRSAAGWRRRMIATVANQVARLR